MAHQSSQAERLSVAYTRLWSPTWLHVRPLISGLRDASAFATGLLLDVGCGNKPYLPIFSPHIRGYIGLDLPPETGTRPDVVGVGNALPFSNASFDTVLLTQVLEHVPNPSRMLGEINRVLKPGGYLILTAPQAWRLHEVPHDFYRFTRFGLEYLAKIHGLDIVLLKPLGGSYALVGQILLNTWFASLKKLFRPQRKGMYWLFILLTVLIALVTNLVFAFWDTLIQDTDDTLAYIVIAEKSAK